jgi:shikimate dehydrogenase
MRLYGLIGYPLSHSFSKKYFTEKFNKQGHTNEAYENFPIDAINKLNDVIHKNPDLVGLNVTIPYKEQVIRFLDEVHEEANEISAVNTIRIVRNNGANTRLEGYNTDVFGFRESLKPFLTHGHKKALILGTGGASKAIKYVLKSLDIHFISVSRNPNNKNILGYRNVDRKVLSEYTVIINTTPLGTYPNIHECPDIPYNHITDNHLLYDLVYNPEVTSFLKKGRQQGATTVNGLKMLHLQAEKSYEIWNA